MKQMRLQKRLAARILKCSPYRVRFDTERLEDIKGAITKTDVRGMISAGAIREEPIIGISKFRARKTKAQKRKGRQKGHGSRKGRWTARQPQKGFWIRAIRAQRDLIKTLKEKKLITPADFRMLYAKAKGGFFRSTRHIKLYLEENSIIKKK